MRGRNDSRNEQFEISPETIEQELRLNLQTATDRSKANYSIDFLYF